MTSDVARAAATDARNKAVLDRAEARSVVAEARKVEAELVREKIAAAQDLVAQLDHLEGGKLTQDWIVDRLRDVAKAAGKAGDLGTVRAVLNDLTKHVPPPEEPTGDERAILIDAVVRLGRPALEEAAKQLGLTVMTEELAVSLTRPGVVIPTGKRPAAVTR